MEMGIELIKEAINNKDLFTSLILVFIILVVIIPMINNMVKTVSEKIVELGNNIKTNGQNLEKYFLTLRASLISNSNKKTMNNDDLLLFAKVLVWYASKEKVEFLKRRLRKNNIMDIANQLVIKQQIKSELIRLSMEGYIDYLRDYSIGTVGNLGDWIYSNFPMDDFLREIYDIFFHEYEGTEKENISKKTDRFYDLMSAYQNDLWFRLKGELNDNNIIINNNKNDTIR